MQFEKVNYADLNAKQKENYNYQKAAGILADYGFTTIRLTDDWQGADFIAVHVDGQTSLLVQLKSRLTFDKKYLERNIWVCFHHEGRFYLYPHDILLMSVLAETNIGRTMSWRENGGYSFPYLNAKMLTLLEKYRLA